MTFSNSNNLNDLDNPSSAITPDCASRSVGLQFAMLESFLSRGEACTVENVMRRSYEKGTSSTPGF